MDAFTCVNCRKTKDILERAAISLPAKLGLLVSFWPGWSASFCRRCSRQVEGFGWFCLVVFVLLIGLALYFHLT